MAREQAAVCTRVFCLSSAQNSSLKQKKCRMMLQAIRYSTRLLAQSCGAAPAVRYTRPSVHLGPGAIQTLQTDHSVSPFSTRWYIGKRLPSKRRARSRGKSLAPLHYRSCFLQLDKLAAWLSTLQLTSKNTVSRYMLIVTLRLSISLGHAGMDCPLPASGCSFCCITRS